MGVRSREPHQLLRQLVVQVQQVEPQGPVVHEASAELQLHQLLQAGHALEAHQEEGADTCGDRRVPRARALTEPWQLSPFFFF